MVAIVAFAALIVAVSATITRAVLMLRVGARDSGDLAGKLAISRPVRAGDWPELRLDAVVPDPERDERVLVTARWPAHPESRALLVLAVDQPVSRAHRLLMRWRDSQASLSPVIDAAGVLSLRRRRTNDVVVAILIDETPYASETGC